MRTEIEKYHLRVITVDGLIKMWLAYYGILIHYFSQPQMHHKKKKKRNTWIANCIHKAPVWFISLLSVKGSWGLALTHVADQLGCGSTLASWVGSCIQAPSRNPRLEALYIKTMVVHGEPHLYAYSFHHQGNSAPSWLSPWARFSLEHPGQSTLMIKGVYPGKLLINGQLDT